MIMTERALPILWPQSGAGKTIMTTELKFVPDDAILIEVKDGVKAKVRLVDCVGYAIDGALGFMESGWSQNGAYSLV